jgi:hypothetical protein
VSLFKALGRMLYTAAADQIDRDEYDAATRRWQERNARQPRVCNCGAPGTVLRTHDGNLGAVPVEYWYCAAHADVPLTVPWSAGVPLWRQNREECSWRTWNTVVGVITECGCSTHVGEEAPR